MADAIVFTKWVFRCTDCRKIAHVSEETIKDARDNWDDQTATPQAVADSLDYCLSCITGEKVPGEHVEEPRHEWRDGAVWELRNLTPADVANLELIAGIAEEDLTPVLGLKIRELVQAVKGSGNWPEGDVIPAEEQGEPDREIGPLHGVVNRMLHWMRIVRESATMGRPARAGDMPAEIAFNGLHEWLEVSADDLATARDWALANEIIRPVPSTDDSQLYELTERARWMLPKLERDAWVRAHDANVNPNAE
jgi:hypothetical protein